LANSTIALLERRRAAVHLELLDRYVVVVPLAFPHDTECASTKFLADSDVARL
jgi:hypothetical protein